MGWKNPGYEQAIHRSICTLPHVIERMQVDNDPDRKIDLKTFHCSILNDHEALKKEHEGFSEIPVIRELDNGMVNRNYLQLKQDMQEIIQSEMERVLD